MPENRLAGSASPYLAAAATQPVHWYPWGDDAFRAAEAQRRPILLDIGAAWCHWCHVMDRESYESASLAAFLNDHFVCIKVDRDERPDVDARYQRAVQAVSGQGGWPLTALLTPDGRAFFGGTYFPPESIHGRPGFRTVLRSALDAWNERRPQVQEQADTLTRLVSGHLDESAPGALSEELLDAGAAAMLQVFDPQYGGFGRQPKFPHPAALRFLLSRWQATGDGASRDAVERTLDGMALGGFHDQLGGGFHRYSVDERWIVPHFEKMSYDNAELLLAYLEGALAFGEVRHAEVARGVMHWVRDTLAIGDGGYGASQDADVGLDDDGDYWTWTRAEAEAALSPEEFAVAEAYWDIHTAGEMHHDPGRNVLFVAESAGSIARRMGLGEARVSELIEQARAALLRARSRRPAPLVDVNRYASWNAMLASAMLRAGAALGDRAAVAHALLTLERVRAEAPGPDRVAHARDGDTGLLEDGVFVAEAALTAFEVTGDDRWLAWVVALAERLWRDHEDARDGALFDLANDAVGGALLAARGKPAMDSPTPSPNGLAAIVAIRLAHLTGDERWRVRAERVVGAFAGGLRSAGVHAATMLRAADWIQMPVTQAVIAGPAGDPAVQLMHQAAFCNYLPRLVVRRVTSASAPGTPPEVGALLAASDGRAVAMLCVGRSCRLPRYDADAWQAELAAAAAPPA